MKPVEQTKLHIPGEINGNCMCAAIASILEIGIEDVPHFEDMSDGKWYLELRRWLKKKGYHLITYDKEVYLPGYFIAHGPSIRGFEHSVVYKGTEMVHDPHPSKVGLEKVKSIWALLPLDPALFKDKEEIKQIKADEKKLRYLLWLNHGHPEALYGDDGEMQCSHYDHYLIDFKRDSVEDIARAFERKIITSGSTGAIHRWGKEDTEITKP